MQRRMHTPQTIPLEVPWDAKWMNALANLLLLGFFAMAVGAALWWALRHPSFSLQRITVDGDVAHSNEVTLRANVAPRLQGNFFTMDLAQARASFEAVPWVRRAVVRREFPNRLRVTLEEHQPVAVWGLESDGRMVNQQGELFEANVMEADVERMPRLMGPDAQSAEVLGLYRLLTPMFTPLNFELSSLELTARGSWRAQLEGGSVVELGRGQAVQVQERVLRLTQTLTQVASRYGRRASAMESADLRHDNGYALRLRGVSTLEAQPVKR